METSEYLWDGAGGRGGILSSDVDAAPLQNRAVSGAAEGAQKPQNGSVLGKVKPHVFKKTTILQFFRSTHFIWIKDVF